MEKFTKFGQRFTAGKRLLALGVLLGAASQSAQAQTQYFGVFSERASITNKLVYGPTVHIYLWNNLVDITTPPPVPFEGQQVWAERAGNGADWFGMGVDNPAQNMGAFSNGALKFQFKTAYTGHVKFGIKSGPTENWINFPAGSTQYGLVRDGNWHEVTIPVSAFKQVNQALDLTALTSLFMFAGDPAGASADFYFDDIFYTSAVVSSTAQARALDASCTLAPNPSAGQAQLAFKPAQNTSFEVALYDLKGARLSTLASGTAVANQTISLPVESSALANGIYLVKLTTGQTVITRRLVVNN